MYRIASRSAVLAVLATFLFAPPLLAESFDAPEWVKDASDVSWWVGDVPTSCVEVAKDARYCTWVVTQNDIPYRSLVDRLPTKEDELALVCRVAGSENLAGCNVFAGKRAADYDRTHRGMNRSDTLAKKKRARSAVQERLDGIRSVAEVVEFVGSAPDRCTLGRLRQCSWLLDDNEPGYEDLRLVASQDSDQIRLFCAFARETKCRTTPLQ